jgi:hypothetical protein
MLAMKRTRGGRTTKVAASTIAATVLLGGTLLLAPATAYAKPASNTFTFAGAYSGTLKLKSSNLDCLYGKSNGQSFIITLSHMKGTISGAGPGLWTMTAYPMKKGTNQVAKANVHSLTDASFQSNADPIIAFDETSGSVTYHGSTGSIDMTVEYHAIGSESYGGSSTVTGSWNCPNGLDLG